MSLSDWLLGLRRLGLNDSVLGNLTAEDLDSLNWSVPAPLGTPPPPCYCGGALRQVASSYREIHGYLSLIVCIFGTVTNLLNIAVLSRQRRPSGGTTSGPGSSGGSTSVVRILVGIAVADVLVMLEYVPFAAYMYLYTPSDQKRFSHAEAVYILVHMHFSQLMHTVSISLTLTLALWRYLAVQLPQRPQGALCPAGRGRLPVALASAVGLSVLICIPSYFVFSVRATRIVEHRQVVTLYHVDLSELARRDGELAFAAHFWLFAVVLKLLPCALLTALSCRLLSLLWQVNARRERLRLSGKEDKGRGKEAERDRRRPDQRTSGMLVAVLLLFLITEVPQGVLGLLSGVLGHCFFRNCYHQLGELLDILALLNGAVTFVLYCWMSRQFRDTFAHMFKGLAPPLAPRRRPRAAAAAVDAEGDVQTTVV